MEELTDRQKSNLIVELTLNFSFLIIKYSELLETNKKVIIARQILRSGTSIGANVWEAQNCESRKDFIHKIKIAMKEADETFYWLLLCKYSNNYPDPNDLLGDVKRISRVLNKINQSARSKSEKATV